MANFFDTIRNYVKGSNFTRTVEDEDWYDTQYAGQENIAEEDMNTYDVPETTYDKPVYENYETHDFRSCLEDEMPAEQAYEEPDKKGFFNFFRGRNPEPEQSGEEEVMDYTEPRVVDINDRRMQQVIVVKPQSLEDAQLIASELRAGRVVICNFEGMHDRVAQRVMDFLAGSSFALDGHLMTISGQVFVITPKLTALSEGLSQRQEDETMENLRRYKIG